MRWYDRISFYVKSLFQKRKMDTQLSEEIREHMEMVTEANVAKGRPPKEGRYAAMREFLEVVVLCVCGGPADGVA